MYAYDRLGSLIDTYVCVSYYGLSEGSGDVAGVPVASGGGYPQGLSVKHHGAHRELGRMEREIDGLVERYERMLERVVGSN